MSDNTQPGGNIADITDDAVIGRALRWSLVFLVLFAMVGGGVAWWVNRAEPIPTGQEQQVTLPAIRAAPEVQIPALPFRNVTSESGIQFVHENGATGQKMLPETMGGGCAFLDYDNDHDQDILLVNSTRWPWDEPAADGRPTTVLYANDGQGRFHDVSSEVGLDIECYGMGVAVGDFDNDGDPDVFVSAVGENRLLRNEGGRFVDVTATSQVGGDPQAWSTSCGWFDYDNDGDLDLVVGNYVRWSREIDLAQDFRLTGIGRAYGPPFSFEGSFAYLYRNDGDGQFRDVSAESGIQVTNPATGVPLAKTLGVALTDVDRDGWIDMILANDTVRNLLFRNQGDGTFREIGVESGIAFDSSGKARGAMGIDAAQFRSDESLGIAIANFANEMTALYIATDRQPIFTDDAIPTGLGPVTRGDLTFGLFFFDADLDGRLDLCAANGHLERDIELVQKSQQYRQPPCLFWNAGPDQPDEFIKLTPEDQIGDLQQPLVGRGAAYADIDDDGDLDLLITQIADAPALLVNEQSTGHHFLRLKLVGQDSNRDAIGAWVEVERVAGTIRRQVMPTRSYLSQVELPVTIGLGPTPEFKSVHVRWPDGARQQVTDVVVDGTTIVQEAGR